MIELLYSKQFLKSSKKLPKTQQIKLANLLELLSNNPYSPLLHTKPLSGQLTGFYSFRITREYRVIFQFTSPTQIKLIETAHRKEIYRWVLIDFSALDGSALGWLDQYSHQIPRTMLRYAIEKLDEKQRLHYLGKNLNIDKTADYAKVK